MKDAASQGGIHSSGATRVISSANLVALRAAVPV